MSKRAILVVDLQNEYWPTGNLPLQGIEAAAANAARVMAHARDKGDLVVSIRHEMPGGPIFVPGSEGAQINEAVLPQGDEPVVTKNFPNSFRETGLKALLDEHSVQDVIVIGAMSHMCIDATTRAAFDHGFKCTVAEDACATRPLEFAGRTLPARDVHAAFIAALAAPYAKIAQAEACIAALGARA